MKDDSFKLKSGNGIIYIILGDITEMKTDAIVNAANEHLILGAGVAGAIRKKGGSSIQKECDLIGGTFVGGAVITNAGKLPAKYVIHAVGPHMGEGAEDEKLRNAVGNSLRIAAKKNLRSIALPAISTGIFGFPLERCALLMIEEIKKFLQDSHSVKDVYIVLWDRHAYSVFEKSIVLQKRNS